MKLSVKLKNCYGIHNLEYDFDFSNNNCYMIYAPNGTMKSSFAKTFKDFSENKDSIDRIYHERETNRLITSDTPSIFAENIFVIEPYNESYESNQVSTLLVNKELKILDKYILKTNHSYLNALRILLLLPFPIL